MAAPPKTKARLAYWRSHRLKVSWRLAPTSHAWVDDPSSDVHAVLREQHAGEVALGRRLGFPASVRFDRRVSRLTCGVRSPPQPVTSNPAGASSQPQAQGGI